MSQDLSRNSGIPPHYGDNWYGDHAYMDQFTFTGLYPKRDTGAKIRFFDQSESFKGEISEEQRTNVLGRIRFEWREFGCGTFSFDLKISMADLAANHNITVAMFDRVDIHLFGDIKPWYTGIILDFPHPSSTERPSFISGAGFHILLDKTFVNLDVDASTFPDSADREVSKVSDYLMQNVIEPQTRIVYDVNKITATDPAYTITDLPWPRVTARKAMADLAEIAQDYVFGVDEQRDFFFRPRSSDVNLDAIRWVGKDVKEFNIRNAGRKIANQLLVFSGKITDGSNFVTTVSDAASISSNGIWEKKVTMPSALDSADATRWANDLLDQLKDPKTPATVKGVLLKQTLIKPVGQFRIFDLDGTQFQLPMKRCRYTVDSKGAKVDIDLDEAENPVADEIADLRRDLAVQSTLAESNASQ